MTEACENSDHDGFQAPATVRISDSSTTTLRCTYCAEGWMTSLIRKGTAFSVVPIASGA